MVSASGLPLLNSPEKVEGGFLYKNILEPNLAESYGQIILSLYEDYGPASFDGPRSFYTPEVHFGDGSTRIVEQISKAWIFNRQRRMPTGCVFLNDLADPRVDSLVELGDELDRRVKRDSVDRCVFIYKPRALMFAHFDQFTTSRSLDLAGTATMQWHDPQTGAITSTTELGAGNMLRINGNVKHSVFNPDYTAPRVAMALVDD